MKNKKLKKKLFFEKVTNFKTGRCCFFMMTEKVNNCKEVHSGKNHYMSKAEKLINIL
jgi:hypothetical protein